jgi:hypothetical protein
MNKKSPIYKKSLEKANKVFGTKSSAYRSAYIVKTYKGLGGKIDSTETKTPYLDRWFNEKWIQVIPYLESGKIVDCGNKTKSPGKACRPLKRISKNTPITIDELVQLHSKKDLINTAKIKDKSPNKRVIWKTLKVL